jgi:hypothetical protein
VANLLRVLCQLPTTQPSAAARPHPPPTPRPDQARKFAMRPEHVGPRTLTLVAAHVGGTAHTVDLAGCRHVTDAALAHLLTAAAPRLQSLCLARCASLTDASLVWLADCAPPHLKVLDITDCPGFSDPGLCCVARATSDSLRVLRAGGCPALTDAPAAELARALAPIRGGGPGLRQLDLDRAVDVADAGIVAMAQRCALLQRLNVGGLLSSLCGRSPCSAPPPLPPSKRDKGGKPMTTAAQRTHAGDAPPPTYAAQGLRPDYRCYTSCARPALPPP